MMSLADSQVKGEPGRGAGLPLSALCLLAFFSGFSALCYEIVWTRLLSLRLGTTTAALTAVLVAFMLGLAVGSWLFGRLADRVGRSLRLYALLEAGIGLSALAAPAVIRLLPPGPPRPFPLHFSLAPFGLFAASVLVLAVPTLFMGGVLPALLASAGWRRGAGSKISALYAINTFGGVVGVLAATFVGFVTIGIARTNLAAACVNFALALTAAALAGLKSRTGHTAPVEPSTVPVAPLPNRLAAQLPYIVAAAACGLAVLGLEICWSRAMAFVLFGRNIYVVTIMLATVLCGLAVGGALAGPLARRWQASRVLGLCLVGLGAAGTISLAALLAMPSIVAAVGHRSWSALVLGQALGAALVILPATVLSGIALPIAAGAETERRNRIAGFGDVYAANTLGAVAGPIVATYLLIPSVGIRGTALILALVCWLAGAVLFRPRPIVTVLALGVLLFGMIPVRGPYIYGLYARHEEGAKLLYTREGVGATVTVLRMPTISGLGTFRVLDIDATNVAGTNHELIAIQKLQGHLPLILHGKPRSVLHIGFGSGGTCYSASLHNLARLDAVELSPEVLEAADMFPDTNHGVLSNPKLHVYVDDARSFLEGTKNRYDAILSDSIHPQILGNASLYSEDYFRLCKSRLAPGGVLSFWLPIYSLSQGDVKLILRTLANVFPECYLWYPNVVCSPFTIVTAFNGRKAINRKAIEREMSLPAVRDDLAEIDVIRPRDLLSFLLLRPSEIADLCGPGPTNTDDLPVLELSAPRASDRMRTWTRNFGLLLSASGVQLRYTRLLLGGQMSQLVYHSEDAFRSYGAARKIAFNDYADREGATYALEAGDAEEVLSDLLAEAPNNLWYRSLLARLKVAEGAYYEAIVWLEPFSARLDARSRVLLAMAYSSLREDAKAKRLLENTEPKTPEVLAALGGIAQREGRIGLAIENYGLALAVDRRKDWIRKELAGVLVKSGSLSRAAQEYAVLAQRTPADVDVLCRYAGVLDRLGRHDEAERQRAAARRIGG